jgi:PKD repeat protein
MMGHASADVRSIRRGFTIAEATIATLIVSVAMFATVTSASKSITNRSRVADRVKAQQLALDLMSEILQQTYSPPATPDPTGPARAGWTCVDDYNGYSETPPVSKSGTPIPDASNLTRSIVVQWINPATMLATTTLNTGIKMITVTVSRSSLVLASISAYRTIGWVDTIPKPTDSTSDHPPTAVAALASGYSLTGNGAPFTTGFTGANSISPSGKTLSYVWTFGDGTDAPGATVTHTYNAVGTYTVQLTVDDGCGGVGIGTLTVTVNPHS